jgi:hypothetical protein
MPTDRAWRVLIANVTLAGHTGTETATRDLAHGLRAAGHAPMVYAPTLGDLADRLRAAGIPVVARLTDLPDVPDLVHGHHHVETLTALLRFPGVPGLFVCHDRTAAASAPPRLDRIRRYVAVDLNCLERLRDDYGIPAPLARVIHNAVDLARFQPRAPLPPRPQRAAIFSNYAGPGTHLESVQAACARVGLPLDVIGAGVNREEAEPERVLGAYDLVFAKGRAAIEALATGAAVILCDAGGLGPMVTTAAFEELRWWNFGRRTLGKPLDPDAIVLEIERYNAEDAAGVTAAIRARAGLDDAIQHYLEAYREILATPVEPRSLDEELAEYFHHTATRVGDLEQELAAYKQPLRMTVLGDRDCEALTLRLVACPAAVPANHVFGATATLDNHGAAPLGTFPPWPVNLSYRWLDADTGRTIVEEGLRTPVAGIAAGATGTCVMSVVAPTAPGRWRLRVVLVQEGLRWLDQLARPLADETIVSVTASDTPA